MSPGLARRAAEQIRALNDSSTRAIRGCIQCHCSDCLRDYPHDCHTTRLLAELDAAANEKIKGWRQRMAPQRLPESRPSREPSPWSHAPPLWDREGACAPASGALYLYP